MDRWLSEQLPDAYQRALEAGASEPLDYVGAGQYGIVFCDGNNHAWKVARVAPGESPAFMREAFQDEYEWLRAVEGTAVEKSVARAYAFHSEEIAIERECIRGRAGVWSDDAKLMKLHERLAKTMERERGWTAPEFKEDSYVITEKGAAILVDASMTQRLGMTLAEWIQDVLDGHRKTQERWHDLAFYLLREKRYKTIPRPFLEHLLARLVEKDPEIARSFSL